MEFKGNGGLSKELTVICSGVARNFMKMKPINRISGIFSRGTEFPIRLHVHPAKTQISLGIHAF